MVEAGGLFPAALAVAAAAILAQRFFVLVIFGMASQAGLTQLDPVQIAGMADGASRAAVLATQGVPGVNIMVETAGLPQVDTVTRLAFFAKLPFVALAIVIFLMTSNAGARCILVVARLMARITFHAGMLAQQREMGAAVVKLGLLPATLVVAISAFGTQRPLVLVVFGVANAALRRSLTEFFARHMAFDTFQRLVFAME